MNAILLVKKKEEISAKACLLQLRFVPPLSLKLLRHSHRARATTAKGEPNKQTRRATRGETNGDLKVGSHSLLLVKLREPLRETACGTNRRPESLGLRGFCQSIKGPKLTPSIQDREPKLLWIFRTLGGRSHGFWGPTWRMKPQSGSSKPSLHPTPQNTPQLLSPPSS